MIRQGVEMKKFERKTLRLVTDIQSYNIVLSHCVEFYDNQTKNLALCNQKI